MAKRQRIKFRVKVHLAMGRLLHRLTKAWWCVTNPASAWMVQWWDTAGEPHEDIVWTTFRGARRMARRASAYEIFNMAIPGEPLREEFKDEMAFGCTGRDD